MSVSSLRKCHSHRVALLIFMLAYCVGCGGGGGSEGSTSSRAGLGGEPIEYVGKTEQAPLAFTNLYAFLDLAFLYVGPSTNQESCRDGGEITTDGHLDEQGNGDIKVFHENCRSDGVTSNGRMRIEVREGGRQTTFITEVLTFEDEDGQGIRISGRVDEYSGFSCEDGKVTYNITLNGLGSDRYYMLENLVETAACGIERNQNLSGRIYISEEGYVDINTVQPFQYHVNHPPGIPTHFPNVAGHITIQGAENTLAQVQFSRERTKDTEEFIEFVRFEVDFDGDNNVDRTVKFTQDQLDLGVAYDLNDFDGDSQVDSWEIVYGLNPMNPNDGLADNDGDGYTNLMEFLAHGDPNDSDVVPKYTDIKTAITLPAEQEMRAGRPVELEFAVQNSNPTYRADITEYLISKPTGVDWWRLDNACETVSENDVVCQVTSRYSPTVKLNLNFIANRAGDFEFSFLATSDLPERDQADNQSSSSVQIEERQVDLSVRIQAHNNYDENQAYAIVDDTTQFLVYTENDGPDPAGDVELIVFLPDNVSATASFLYQDPDTYELWTKECLGESELVCEIGNQNYESITLLIEGETDGVRPLSFKVESDGIELDSSNNTASLDLYVGRSLSPYQDMQNEGTLGDEIILPPGVYVGYLSLSSGTVSLVSEAGSDDTTIWITGQIRVGRGARVSGFTFRGGGYVIAYENEGFEISNNVFIGMDNAIQVNRSNGSVDFNYFKGGYGGYSCSQIRFGWQSAGRIYGNVFENNRYQGAQPNVSCGALDLGDIAEEKVLVANNTFLDNDFAIRVSNYFYTDRIDIYNNLLVGNEIGFNNSNIEEELEKTKLLNNLFYDNGTDISGLWEHYENDNFFVDPMFSNEWLKLEPGSPAIDAGIDIDGPLVDFFGNDRPVDGDGDGAPSFDIGATEFDSDP